VILNAEHLALQPEGSRLTWSLFDDGLIAGDYQIRCTAPEVFELSRRGEVIAVDKNVTGAYRSADQHDREVGRHRVQRRLLIRLAAAGVAWFLVDVLVQATDAVWLLLAFIPIVWIGFTSAAGFLTTLGGDVNGRYRTLGT
jgi:hypothetical protein